jgi:hypothetical protein
MYLSGFAARTHASEGVLHDLWAKALAVEDASGERVVIVTVDLIGFGHELCDDVAARVTEYYGLKREDLLFNASHTHSGPLVLDDSPVMFELDDEQLDRTKEYFAHLQETLCELIGAVLDDLAPAQLWFGSGTATFAVNRRERAAKGIVNGYYPEGPSDHSVPVLKVTATSGEVRALLCLYACHPTVIGPDSYLFCGDYAGFAQLALEDAFPGATAFFMQGCGADQNALPRHHIELARAYGHQLAAAVRRVLTREMQPVRGTLRSALEMVEIELAPHTRALFEARLTEEHELNPWRERHARLMLQAYDEGRPLRSITYPLQAIGFGDDLTLLALGGEVVVDYALRLKREFVSRNLIVAGYSNDVMAYIPSLRVLHEGGYEGGDAMIFFGLPMPFAETVEEEIVRAAHRVIERSSGSAP